MKQSMPLLIGIIFIIPQCAKIQPKKTFEPIKKQSKKRINVAPDWMSRQQEYPLPTIKNQNITMQNAIAFGLQYNPNLQAHFDEIGIRKADLVQAGFYSNPHVESVFRIPTKDNNNIQTNIEISANFMLSDLWQVPLRKKIAQHSLEMKTHEVMNEIMMLRKQIQLAYLECIYKKEYVSLVTEITTVIHKIKERIDYRYQFGFNTKLDKYFAASKVAEWQANIINANTELDTAYISLHKILGMPISSTHLALVDSFMLPHINALQQELEQFALISHPTILIEQSKITKAQASINYERSKYIDNVQLGIAYERDFEKSVSGVGPAFGINIPLFDTNYGNIERAKFEMKQAKKALIAQKRIIFANIAEQFTLYNSYVKQLEHYKKLVIPPVMKAINFSKEYLDKMQMNMIVFLQTQIDLFMSKLKILELKYKAAQQYIELEFSVGARLQNLIIKRNNA